MIWVHRKHIPFKNENRVLPQFYLKNIERLFPQKYSGVMVTHLPITQALLVRSQPNLIVLDTFKSSKAR